MAVITSYRPPRTVHHASWLAMLSRHAVVAYWVLALGISWLIWLPLVVEAQGWADWHVPFALHYLGAFGPLAAALIMTWVLGGTTGIQELWNRITRWQVSWASWLVAVGSPIALFGFALLETAMVHNPLPNLAQLGQVNYLPYLGIWAPVLWIITFGFGEEIGWRGFALPRLQRGHSALWATLLLGGMWALWHLPAFFYLDTYMRMGIRMFPMFALGLMAGAVVLTWLFNTSGGSILMTALWHALFNMFTATRAADEMMQTLMSVVIMVAAVAIVVVYKPMNLSRHVKFEIHDG